MVLALYQTKESRTPRCLLSASVQRSVHFSDLACDLSTSLVSIPRPRTWLFLCPESCSDYSTTGWKNTTSLCNSALLQGDRWLSSSVESSCFFVPLPHPNLPSRTHVQQALPCSGNCCVEVLRYRHVNVFLITA